MFGKLKACLPFKKTPKRDKYLTEPTKRVQESQKETISPPPNKKYPTKLIPANKFMNKRKARLDEDEVDQYFIKLENSRDLDFTGDDDGDEIKDESLRKLAKAMKCSSKSMQKLSVYSSFARNAIITNAGIEIIGESLKYQKDLKSLSLSFSSCDRVTEKGFENLCQSLKTLKSLEIVYLKFSSNDHVSDALLEMIGKQLKKLKCLKDITLDFLYCKLITDAGLKSLGQDLKRLPSLKKLGLCLMGCSQITGAGFDLTSFKSLESLQLKFPKYDFSGARWEDLTVFTALKSFGLGLSHDRQDVTLDYVSKSLGKLSSLQSLRLECWRNKELTDMAFERFSQTLKKIVFVAEF